MLAGDAWWCRAAPATTLFQSAPAIAGGRCVRRTLVRVVDEVSIRARHCWRAMRHAPARRRAGRRVSIRARHCWRAMLGSARLPPTCTSFQSAPAIAGGRCSSGWTRCSRSPSFNPRPPLLAGDACPDGEYMTCSSLFQSAPAIAGGRCRTAPASSPTTKPFQSAPAIAGGRCGQDGGVAGRAGEVSIRARHCWRAMRHSADSKL